MTHSLRLMCYLLMTSAVLMPFDALSEKIRAAVIDPLSGAFAPNGENKLCSFQMIADLANKER